MPQHAAGIRIEPPESVPSPTSTSPAAATISSDPGKSGTSSKDAATAARAAVPDGPPAGPAALRVAREFAEGFVVYEPGGELVTGSLMHYALPRATDMPPLTIAETITPSPNNPLGTKGVGESGCIIGTAPIMNAVVDALAPLGVTHLDMPYTSQSVWAAIQAAKGGQA